MVARASRVALCRRALVCAWIECAFAHIRERHITARAVMFAVDALCAQWASLVAAASAAIGLPHGATTFLLGLVLGAPIGCGFHVIDRTVPRPYAPFARSMYALVSGVMLSFASFGRSTIVCAHFGVFSYVMMVLWRRRCGVVVFVASFAYLIQYHYNADTAMTWKRGEVDISGLLMVLVLKVTACAMNYEDASTTELTAMNEFQKRRHIKELPNVLDYASWLMFPCTLVSGPAIEFRDYTDWLNKRGVWGGRTPSAVKSAVKKFAMALLFLALHTVITSVYTIDNTYLNPKWMEYSLLHRIWHMHIYGEGNRYKYYFVWLMADFACTVAGIGFSGYDAKGQPTFETATNIHPLGVTKAVTLNSIPLHWNIQTGMWLRNYVYDRVTPAGMKPGLTQLLITQIVSGVWHGLYAGYWFFFVSSAFAVNAGRLIYRLQVHRVPKRFHNFVNVPHWFVTQFGLNYLCAAFILIDYKECLTAWGSVYYWAHWALAFMIIIGTAFAPKPKPKAATKTE